MQSPAFCCSLRNGMRDGGDIKAPPRSIPLYFLWIFSDTFRRTKSACKPFLLFSIKSTEPRAIFLFIHFYPKVEQCFGFCIFYSLSLFLSIYIKRAGISRCIFAFCKYLCNRRKIAICKRKQIFRLPPWYSRSCSWDE